MMGVLGEGRVNSSVTPFTCFWGLSFSAERTVCQIAGPATQFASDRSLHVPGKGILWKHALVVWWRFDCDPDGLAGS